MQPSIDSIPTLCDQVAARKVGNELLLVPIHRTAKDVDCIYTLNVTAAFIWECMDGQATIADIIEKVVSAFEVHRGSATDDVITVLEDLKKLEAISY